MKKIIAMFFLLVNGLYASNDQMENNLKAAKEAKNSKDLESALLKCGFMSKEEFDARQKRMKSVFKKHKRGVKQTEKKEK